MSECIKIMLNQERFASSDIIMFIGIYAKPS